MNRREFLATSAAASVGFSLFGAESSTVSTSLSHPAILGGNPVRTTAWPAWPVFDETEESAMLKALRGGKWFRGSGNQVVGFEKAYAKRAGAKHCVATSSGTTALLTTLGALNIGPGDEVILPPYTFVATYNVITMHYALPIFVDIDIATSQLDAEKIEAAITPNTKAIIPVHLGGNCCDMDKILEVAKKHNIPVIEDACQSHLAEWRGKMVGTWGTAGCFSFQASKNLNAGEGGAIVTNDDDFANLCFGFQDQGRPKGTKFEHHYTRGANLRMTEFQGALLQAQMTRIEEQAKRRTENAKYLESMLKDIPGIQPQQSYAGCTRNAYHLFAFRYNAEHFAGLSRDKFMHALNREGIECAAGYVHMPKGTHIQNLLANRHYQRLYSKDVLERFAAHCECPQNKALCEVNVRFTQNQLLGPRSDMNQIAEAIRKIQVNAAEIMKA
ncbi:MAG: stsC [Verrucomicrobiales bacterium]|nr:stsC [Verrucomicrobiales bacterium]